MIHETESNGGILITGQAVVSRFYENKSKCEENTFRCMNVYPNKFKDCFSPKLYYPERRKHIPKSLKGTPAIVAAITVCTQTFFLPNQ